MKTISEDLLPIWDELQDIFEGNPKWNDKMADRLEKLGFKTGRGKHPKIEFEYNGKHYMIGLSCTSSDKHYGKQMLRKIRRIYEGEIKNERM